jgi:NTP pyrophosphatase (non-canonical NTP hydrolase)
MSAFVTAFIAQMKAIQAVNASNGFTTEDSEFLEKLAEEVDEVGLAMVDYYGQNPNKETALMNLTLEMADVIIVLMFHAAAHGLQLAEAIEAKNIYNSKRGYLHGKTQS